MHTSAKNNHTYHLCAYDIPEFAPECRFACYSTLGCTEIYYIVEDLPQEDISILILKGASIIRLDIVNDCVLIDGYNVADDIQFAYNLLVWKIDNE